MKNYLSILEDGPANLVRMVVDEFVRVRPAAPLLRFVAWYSGYRQIGVPAALHRGLPSPFLTLIFTLDDPLVLAQHTDPAHTPDSYDALLAGLHTVPAVIAHDGRQSGVQIAVSPLASRALFAMPASELTGSDGHAADVLGVSRVDEIRAALLGLPTWQQRLAALGRLLWRDAAPEQGVAPEVDYAWRRLCQTCGRIPVRALADETGWSARHLQARFRVETGLTPKQAARKAGGAQIVAEPHHTDYGSYDFTLLDPEGNRWCFGTYRGEPRKH